MGVSDTQAAMFESFMTIEKDEHGVFSIDGFHLGTAKALARKGFIEMVPNPSETKWKGRIINWWLHGLEEPVTGTVPDELGVLADEVVKELLEPSPEEGLTEELATTKADLNEKFSYSERQVEKCKTVTLFRTIDDLDSTKWRRINKKFTKEIEAAIVRKYGDKLAVILNKLLGQRG